MSMPQPAVSPPAARLRCSASRSGGTTSTPRAACSAARSNFRLRRQIERLRNAGDLHQALDVDKVDLLFAPYGTVPTAPIMPLVKQRGLLLMGNFSFQVNARCHDMWFNNAPWGPADSWAASFLDIGQKAAARPSRFWRPTRSSRRTWRDRERVASKRNMPIVYDQAYLPNTVEFSADPRLKAAKPDIVFVAPIRRTRPASCAP